MSNQELNSTFIDTAGSSQLPPNPLSTEVAMTDEMLHASEHVSHKKVNAIKGPALRRRLVLDENGDVAASPIMSAGTCEAIVTPSGPAASPTDAAEPDSKSTAPDTRTSEFVLTPEMMEGDSAPVTSASLSTASVNRPRGRRFLDDDVDPVTPPAAALDATSDTVATPTDPAEPDPIQIISTDISAATDAPVKAEEASAKTLISVITQQTGGAVDTGLLNAALLVATSNELQQLGSLAVKGFIKSRWHFAKIFTEASRRSSANGVSGRRPAGVLSFRDFCEGLNYPVKSAQTLVSNLKLVETQDPELLTAAIQAGIDVLKPKVVAEFQLIKHELWEMTQVSPAQTQEYLCRLAAAEGRAPSAKPIKVEPKKSNDVTPKEPDQPTKTNARGPGPKCFYFQAHELTKFDEALTAIRSYPGYAPTETTTEEIVVLAMEQFEAMLEVQHANANSGV